MKVGIMLRHYEQHEGGVKLYTKTILPLLFTLGQQHKYVLMYQNPKLIGTYSSYPNVEEVALSMPVTVLWDQIAVPWIAKRKKLDLIFNPKFTIPFFTKAKTAFVLHGSEWFAIPNHFRRYDQWYFNLFVPLYCRYADAFIAVSNAVKDDAVEYMRVDPAKIFAIHNGFDPATFRPVRDPERLLAVRQKYKLPERFIVWVGQIESRKNVSRLLRAFASIRDKVPHQLVLVGEQRWSTAEELRVIEELKLADRLCLPGWIWHDDLPAVYSLADLFAFPSLYEGFGIPIIEAMACGCPVVTANTCAPPEIVMDAGQVVDPYSVEDIAAAMLKVLTDYPLRQQMSDRGIERATHFSWHKCVTAMLQMLDVIDRQRSAGDTRQSVRTS
jgi:glycosyltransferase involved in cell wall biosynthesis